MKAEYKRVPIGDVADIRRGASPRPIDDWMSPSGIPWVKISDATKSDSRFIYETEGYIREEGRNKSVEVFPEDLIISNSATPGLPRIMKIHACIHDGWLLADNFHGVTRDYLFYQIKYMRRYLVNQGNGSIFTNLKTDILKEFPISIPVDADGNFDIKKQNEIVATLQAIEDKIENNNAICSNLEAMAKLLYDYWFVQFDFPDENGKPYKSSGGKMVWNDELKREIPEGWEVKPLSEVFDITMGSSPSGESLNTDGNGIEFYQGSTDFGELYPSIRVYTTSPVRFAKAQDVLMSVRAPVGDMNIAMNDCCIGRGLAAIHHRSTLFAWCTMLTFKPFFDVYNGNGTTFGALTSDDLKGQIMAVPPLDVLDMFIKKVEAVGENLKSVSIENQQLVSLRDFLLPMLMNGQVTVGGTA